MKTIKFGDLGPDVLFLQAAINHPELDGILGARTEESLKKYQTNNSLLSDGICGPKTWEKILNQREKISKEDIEDLSKALGCEYAALMAVREIESGGYSSFTQEGRPKALFEGHIFWQQLNKLGFNPLSYQPTNKEILYPRWTKQYYLGGDREYDRIQQAWRISPKATMLSTSLGMFQIMGFNWVYTSCCNVGEYWKRSFLSEKSQLSLFGELLKSQGLIKYLINKDWKTFAKLYNGSGYSQNQYDSKLQKAYNKYKS